VTRRDLLGLYRRYAGESIDVRADVATLLEALDAGEGGYGLGLAHALVYPQQPARSARSSAARFPRN